MKRKLWSIVGLVLLLVVQWPLGPVAASGISDEGITRDEIIRRAQVWQAAQPPIIYNQGRYYLGYRTDCSGYVSYALNLTYADGTPRSRVTVDLDNVTYEISKEELLAGDIINDNDAGNAGHVVIFEQWVDAEHTHYWGYELTFSGNIQHRKIDYPYDHTPADFVPRRYNDVRENPVDILTPSLGHFSDVSPYHQNYGTIEALYSIKAVKGSSDGLFHPDEAASRGAVAKVIVLSLGEARQYSDGATVCNVSPSHTFYPFIRRLLELGISNCPGDGDWKPDDSLTRGGLAKFIIRARGEGDPSYSDCVPPFSDVSCSHNFYPHIRRLKEIFEQKDVPLGYTDGTFHPDEAINRGGMTKLIVYGLDLERYIPTFYDVLYDNPFYPYVEGIAARGITSGCTGTAYPRFCPDDPLTRGGAAKFIIRAVGETPNYTDNTKPFSDVEPGDTFYAFIRRLKELHITDGYPDGTFKPELVISRGAMAKFVVRALEVRGIICRYNQPQAFQDVLPTHTFYREIQCLKELGIASGYGDGYFRPDADLSRAAAAKFVYLAFVQRTLAVVQEASNSSNEQCNSSAPDYEAWSRYVVPEQDRDCVRFSVPALEKALAGSGIYRIQANEPGFNADLKIEVLAGDGNTVLASATGLGQSGGTTLFWSPSISGRYYIRLTNLHPYATEGVYAFITAEKVNLTYLPLIRRP